MQTWRCHRHGKPNILSRRRPIHCEQFGQPTAHLMKQLAHGFALLPVHFEQHRLVGTGPCGCGGGQDDLVGCEQRLRGTVTAGLAVVGEGG